MGLLVQITSAVVVEDGSTGAKTYVGDIKNT
jgi:hypothetical protein